MLTLLLRRQHIETRKMSGNAADVRVRLWRGGMCLDGKDKNSELSGCPKLMQFRHTSSSCTQHPDQRDSGGS